METYHGHVRSPQDAILLFEACRIGLLPRVQRRLSEKERQQIKSGSVFVWDEREAGMRRWTDGKSWSASRVSGSFLTYREMEGKRGGSYPNTAPPAKTPRQNGRTPDGSANGDSEEGEGPDGYRYKPDGLMKQSFSITTQGGQHLHLISYYSRSHSSSLMQPSSDPNLRQIRVPKNMYPESSVTETQTVPAVTRGPMPGSPAPMYQPGPQQVGSQSPYPPRPGPHMPVVFSAYPGPPTPPYHPHPTAYYIHPQHHTVYQPQGPIFYYPQHGAHHGPQVAPMDHRLPPHMVAGYPPGAHPAYGGHAVHHPHPHQMAPQYLSQPPPHRPLEAPSQHQQGPPPNSHSPSHHQHQQSQSQSQQSQLPEQGPVLPALNGLTNTQQPTPQPSESARSSDSLPIPDTNNSSIQNGRAPSPSNQQRAVPSIHTLLNDNLNTAPNAAPKTVETATNAGLRTPARTSSRSPPQQINGSASASSQGGQGPQGQGPQEMPAASYGGAHGANALQKLNGSFAVKS